MPEMTRFRYRRWSGDFREIEAATVTFEQSGHVAFRDSDGRIVLVERGEQVGSLRQDPYIEETK